MAIPSAPVSNTTFLQMGNGQALVSWQAVATATSYSVQRSTDSITYTTIAPTVTTLSYLDTTVTPAGLNSSGGTQYWYQVAATNGSGTSAYTPTTPNSVIPVVSGMMSLAQIRLLAQQRADRVNSNFVILPEWNSFINLAADELYDLVTTAYDDYQMYQPVYFTTNGSNMQYPMPDGITTFKTATGSTITPPPIYKLAGIDLGLNNAPNGFVTVQKYNFIDRNKYIFPNTASTIYGVFGLQYRFIGNNVRFIPQPSSNQPIGIWYIPRRVQMLQDTDVSDGFNGWLNYVVVRAAKYALDKEESNTDKLDTEILYLKSRIEEVSANRDEGQADTISDCRNSLGFGSDGGDWGGQGNRGW